MKFFFGTLVSLIICTISIAQNNLIIFSESTEPFQVEWGSNLFPAIPQTDVKLTQINDNPIKVKIIFANPNLKSIDTTLYLFHPAKSVQNQDVIYVIQKNNQRIQYLATLPSSDLKPIIPEVDTTIQVKTREEKTLHKIIFLNDTNNVCLKAMDTADFYKVFKHLEGIPNVDRRIVLMEQFIKHNCFNPTQAQNLLELVPFEVERLKIAKQLLPKLNNVFELENWNFLFKNNVAQQTFLEHYQNYLLNLSNHPTLPDSVLNNFITQIKKLTNDLEILDIMKIIFSHYTITIHQLSTLIHLLQHDQTKEDALKKSYYSLKDKKDFEKTFQWLYFKESKERLKQFYEKQNR